MEVSNAIAEGPIDATSRRKSGRAVQRPVHYQPESNLSANANGSAKRKRVSQAHVHTDENDEETSEAESEEDAEEINEYRRRPAKPKKSQAKPAAKKPKTHGEDGVKLAMRPATNGVRKASKPRRARTRVGTSDVEGTGLFGEVFLAENSTDDLAAAWVERYNTNNAEAMCELINFVLRCTGCDLKIEVQDIEDPDNATNRLGDIQEEYQAQKITEYPLISRAKGNPFSKAVMVEFFESLVQTAHASELLYNDEDLYEHIHIWVSAMSSSSSRPFRHTATVISLSIATAICRMHEEVLEDIATTSRQKESEGKKKSANKARVATLKTKLEESEAKRGSCETWLKDIFDTIFVHRYRDVDPRIRVDCAHAMGAWIQLCPDLFFDGSYLRYLGWLLSDISPAVRGEVVRQLIKLYKSKDNVARLRAFTDKFRPRMIEMATQDAEPNIRASTIELLDLIRQLGLIQPFEVDMVGRMIFDSDVKVRKAISGFFAENVNDLYEMELEKIGGEEAISEALGEDVDDEFDNPRQVWLKLKCLAGTLASYDTENSEEGTPAPGTETVLASGAESRYSMAASVIYDGIDEVREWELLTGFLLYDNSAQAESRTTGDVLESFKEACILDEKEERLLLEVLNAAVKLRLTAALDSETDRKGKRTKARTDESREVQEKTALHLASVIPRLLRKFGAKPSTASAVLRLEHVLNLGIFQELRQDSTDFASLLDDITRQFLTHADHNVLAQASTALLHARTFEDLEEVTEGKLQELWDGTVSTLRQLMRGKAPSMASLSNTVHRIASLASISDCVDAFDLEPRLNPKAKSNAPTKVFDLLLKLIRDYFLDSDAKFLVHNAMQALLFYYMWLQRSFQERAKAGVEIGDLPSYDDFASVLMDVINAKPDLDDLRINAIGTLLDLYASFTSFRNLESTDQLDSATLSRFVKPVSAKATQLILASFTAAEKDLAKRANRSLEGAAEDEMAENPDSEPDDSSEEEQEHRPGADTAKREQRRQQELLLAEKRLVELTSKIIIAIVGQVLDSSGPTKGNLRKRLARNKTKLGANFKEVVAYLDDPTPKRSHKARPKASIQGTGTTTNTLAPLSKELVEEGDEEEEEEEVEEIEEGGEEDLRRRELQDDIVDESEPDEDNGNGAEQSEDEIMGD